MRLHFDNGWFLVWRMAKWNRVPIKATEEERDERAVSQARRVISHAWNTLLGRLYIELPE